MNQPERNQPQRLFDTPAKGGAVSLKVLKQISPSNPESRVSFHLALHLMDQRELARTIAEKGLAAVKRNTTWLKAFSLLEAEGLRKGLHGGRLSSRRVALSR